MERLEEQIDKLISQENIENNSEKKIIKNSRALQISYRDQAKEIDNKIQGLLNSI
ncbi:MAG: hypothetical protein RQ733_12250 [Methyloprofundus sp.]|nr:hypothetical protein [Methyloprofundus sp.]MDT8426729.1 hypothetical protein [Methyloprofundus sp.]